MKQEDKDLLLRDLCCRLPYGVMMGNKNLKETSYRLSAKDIDDAEFDNEFDDIPYLRPMESMTDDEREEIEVFIFNEWYQEDSCKVDREGWIEILANYDVSGIDPGFCSDYVDWLLAHHFDYRGLIEKGLAFEAPEGMYEVQN